MTRSLVCCLAVSQRSLYCSGRGKGGSDTRHNFNLNASTLYDLQFFSRTSKNQRIATL
jgi:hypothetical protein